MKPDEPPTVDCVVLPGEGEVEPSADTVPSTRPRRPPDAGTSPIEWDPISVIIAAVCALVILASLLSSLVDGRPLIG